jgi:hypothetical protein
MRPIPDDILKPFDTILEKKAIFTALRADYRKGLMYYLDFGVLLTKKRSQDDRSGRYKRDSRSNREDLTVGYIEMSYFRELLDVIEKRKKT